MRLCVLIVALLVGVRRTSSFESDSTLRELTSSMASLADTVSDLAVQLAASEAKVKAQGAAIESLFGIVTSLTEQLTHEKAAVAAMTSRLASLEPSEEALRAAGRGAGGGAGGAVLPPLPPALDPRIKTLAPDKYPTSSQQERRRVSEGGASNKGPGVSIFAHKETGMLKIDGSTEFIGDIVVRGDVYISNFTQVSGETIVYTVRDLPTILSV